MDVLLRPCPLLMMTLGEFSWMTWYSSWTDKTDRRTPFQMSRYVSLGCSKLAGVPVGKKLRWGECVPTGMDQISGEKKGPGLTDSWRGFQPMNGFHSINWRNECNKHTQYMPFVAEWQGTKFLCYSHCLMGYWEGLHMTNFEGKLVWQTIAFGLLLPEWKLQFFNWHTLTMQLYLLLHDQCIMQIQ